MASCTSLLLILWVCSTGGYAQQAGRVDPMRWQQNMFNRYPNGQMTLPMPGGVIGDGVSQSFMGETMPGSRPSIYDMLSTPNIYSWPYPGMGMPGVTGVPGISPGVTGMPGMSGPTSPGLTGMQWAVSPGVSIVPGMQMQWPVSPGANGMAGSGYLGGFGVPGYRGTDFAKETAR